MLAPGDWDERVLLPILEGHSRDVMRRRRKGMARFCTSSGFKTGGL